MKHPSPHPLIDPPIQPPSNSSPCGLVGFEADCHCRKKGPESTAFVARLERHLISPCTGRRRTRPRGAYPEAWWAVVVVGWGRPILEFLALLCGRRRCRIGRIGQLEGSCRDREVSLGWIGGSSRGFVDRSSTSERMRCGSTALDLTCLPWSSCLLSTLAGLAGAWLVEVRVDGGGLCNLPSTICCCSSVGRDRLLGMEWNYCQPYMCRTVQHHVD